MQIVNHRLFDDNGTPYRFIQSPNYQRNTKLLACDYLIIHYTTGTKPSQTINWFTSPNSKAVAHLLVTREGEIIQFVPFNIVAWHAGYSQWADRFGLNRYSIGIELDNAGRLVRELNSWKRYNVAFSDDQVLKATHKLQLVEMGWEKFPEAQMDALRQVAELLKATYNFIDVLGHDDVSLSGKLDPGPAFNMVEFRNKIMGFQAGQQFVFKNYMPGVVLRAASKERSSATGRIPSGREVVVLDTFRNWVQVQQVQADGTLGSLKGWMLERYLKRLRSLV
jgi:N-acetylmuramoyl-L-alanine amidase